MAELPTYGRAGGLARSRDTGRLVIEILVWVLAFTVLLCVPAERKTNGHVAERPTSAEAR